MKIKLLSKAVAEKIAAGEVVERPASVIKELMENSLDAGATEVTVKVGEQITARLEVTDNGEGMNREEALLALQRYATSKISDDRDLFNIQTMGFRGEALPSIAAVSNMEIESRETNSDIGVRLVIEAGVVTSIEETGIPRGTRVQVCDLFYTTPARRKFLRSATTEWGHIQDVFGRLSLSRQDVHLQLWKGGRQWLNAPPTKDLKQRIGQIMGWELAEKLYPFESGDDEYHVYGMMARPDYHSVTGRNIFFFVNSRPVRDQVLQKALRGAYRTYIPKDRFPVVFLYIGVPFDQVDVNVHPAKLEVHFASPPRVKSLLQNVLTKMLREAPWDRKTIRSFSVRNGGPVIKELHSIVMRETAAEPSSPMFESSSKACTSGVSENGKSGITSFIQGLEMIGESVLQQGKENEAHGMLGTDAQYRFSSLHILGQFKDEFIVCESEEHLILIDQHAAHERIAFERLRNAFYTTGIEQQALLLPCIAELSARDSEAVERHLSDIYSWGIEVEPYGRNSFAVKTLPALLSHTDPSRMLRDIGEELAETDLIQSVEELRDHVFARMACHSVVRGRRRMVPAEIQALLAEMDAVDFSLNCPHGRPVMASWSLHEVKKRFHRT